MKNVEFIRNGYKTVMADAVAEKYKEKKKIKILGDVKEPEEVEAIELAKAEAKAKAEEKHKELLKIAAELGIKKPDKMKEKELVEAIELAKAEKK